MSPLPLRRFNERELYPPRRLDPYRTKSKPRGAPRCPSCHTVSVQGRWTPAKNLNRVVPPKGKSSLCPACRQLQDRYAMSVVEIHGENWREKANLIFETLDRTEKIARSRNDQERTLWHSTYRGVTKIYVTLPELARQMGRILKHAFKGKVEYHRSSEEPFLRVIWKSDPSPPRRSRAKSRKWRGRGL